MEFNITTSMSQVRDAVTDTELLKAVGPILADIERNYINLQDAKKTVDTESKNRKIEIRDVLKPRIEELEGVESTLKTQVETLKNDNSSESLKKENATLLSFKNQVLTAKRDSFVNRFKQIAVHDKFGKVLPELKLPDHTVEKDKKFDYTALDFSKMSEEDMDANVTALERLDRLEYFGEVKKTVDTDGKTSTKVTSDAFKEKVKKAKTIEEIRALQKETMES